MARTVDYRSLTGTEKAAIFVLSVGEEYATKLFQYMEEEEIRELSHAMTNLGQITADIVDRVFVDFVESLSSTGNLVGTYESTERLLSKALGEEKVSGMLDDIRGPAGRTMWDKLANVNEVVLASYLRNEYPQTVAVILSKIRPEHACNVLISLPDAFASDVLMRMLYMETVQREVLEEIEKTLRNEFVSNVSRGARRDSYEMIADILSNLDRGNETKLLGLLEDRDPEAAEKVRSFMFTFDDLSKVDEQGVQRLIKEVDANNLTLALKGADDSIKELFFGNMSARAAKIMNEEMVAMGAVRTKAVEEAQQEIMTLAKSLAESGEIYISEDNDGDELVY